MMSRVKTKGPYIKKQQLNSFKKTYYENLPRNFEITPSSVGVSAVCYSGKNLVEILITDEMIGHKLGEFIPTRATFVFKKKKKKKK